MTRNLGFAMGAVNVSGNSSVDLISWAVVLVYVVLMVCQYQKRNTKHEQQNIDRLDMMF